MKTKILLVDDSLTVQKVVSLTLDKNRYQVAYAKNRQEFLKLLIDISPDIILLSDQFPEIQVSSFPKEVEAWLGRGHGLPSFVLITSQDLTEARHYQAVLKKPFSPQVLQNCVAALSPSEESVEIPSPAFAEDEAEDQQFQKRFNDIFSDESNLVKETFANDFDKEEPTLLATRNQQTEDLSGTELWQERAKRETASAPQGARQMTPGTPNKNSNAGDLWAVAEPSKQNKSPEILGASDSMAYKAVLQQQVETRLEATNLKEVVEKVLHQMLPGIVEKLVQERLDKLLKDQEQFLELKQ